MLRSAVFILLFSFSVFAAAELSGSGTPWPGETPSEMDAKYARLMLGVGTAQVISIYGPDKLDVDFDFYEDLQPPQQGEGPLRVIHLYAFSNSRDQASPDDSPVLMKSIDIPAADVQTRIHVIHDPKLTLRIVNPPFR